MNLQSGRSVKINNHEIVELFKDGVSLIGIDDKVFDGSFESAIKTTINNNAIAKIEERIKKWKEGIETEKRLGMDDGSMNREYRVLIMEDEIIVELLKGE